MISIIIPVAYLTTELDTIRQNFTAASTPIEVILVIEESLKSNFTETFPFEKVVIMERSGRGFAFTQGLKIARGEFIVFLHADTILPEDWDKLILSCFENNNTVGGGFSLSFSDSRRYLKFLIYCTNVLFKIRGELWGDRALFARSAVLNGHESKLNVPLFEDVRLSRLMKKQGRTVLLKEKVITSAKGFSKAGLFRHTIKIIVARGWYALGGSPERIFRYYYR